MAPAGLVISKLALQATADDHTLRGLLCLKVRITRVLYLQPGPEAESLQISLPKEAESSTNRWPLFNSTFCAVSPDLCPTGC